MSGRERGFVDARPSFIEKTWRERITFANGRWEQQFSGLIAVTGNGTRVTPSVDVVELKRHQKRDPQASICLPSDNDVVTGQDLVVTSVFLGWWIASSAAGCTKVLQVLTQIGLCCKIAWFW